MARSSARYQACPRDEQSLKTQMEQVQSLKTQMEQVRQKHPRFGIRRAHALISAQAAALGLRINHKRVQRLWCKSGFQVVQPPKKRKVKVERPVPRQAERPDHVWSYDFQSYDFQEMGCCLGARYGCSTSSTSSRGNGCR